MTTEQTARGFYRCQIAGEHSKATLVSGGVRIPVVLRESAIDGFTVMIAPKYIRRLQLGRQWVLKTRAEKNRVHPEWVFHNMGQDLQLGLRRVSEIVTSDEPRGGIMTYFGRSNLLERSNHAELAFFGLLLGLFVMLSSPGIGGKLGTAPLIHDVATAVVHSLAGLFR